MDFGRGFKDVDWERYRYESDTDLALSNIAFFAQVYYMTARFVDDGRAGLMSVGPFAHSCVVNCRWWCWLNGYHEHDLPEDEAVRLIADGIRGLRDRGKYVSTVLSPVTVNGRTEFTALSVEQYLPNILTAYKNYKAALAENNKKEESK